MAFTALWDRHIGQLETFVSSKFQNLDHYEVQDICSRSFEKAFRQIHTYDPAKGQFNTWLCTIAKNTARDFLEQKLRGSQRHQLVYLDNDNANSGIEDLIDQTDDALLSLINSEKEEENEKYVERLPELYRTVARKRFIEDMKYAEIAEALDLELNTVKTRIKRAKNLIEALRKEDEENDI